MSYQTLHSPPFDLARNSASGLPPAHTFDLPAESTSFLDDISNYYARPSHGLVRLPKAPHILDNTEIKSPTEKTALRSTEQKLKERAKTTTIIGLLAIGLFVWTIALFAFLWSYEGRKYHGSSASSGNHADRAPDRNWGLYWDNLEPKPSCSGYGIREYSARLMNIPSFTDGLKACKETPIEIHNTTVAPDRCEDQGYQAGMRGFWRIGFNETACLPIWGDLIDEGCVPEKSQLHRITARLWNIQHSDDWLKMCATTPADIRGLHFKGPKQCINRGLWGIYGIWEYKDQSC